jgi:hypothetical protein
VAHARQGTSDQMVAMGQTPRLVAPLNKGWRRVAVREALEDVERHGLHVLSD